MNSSFPRAELALLFRLSFFFFANAFFCCEYNVAIACSFDELITAGLDFLRGELLSGTVMFVKISES